MESSHTKDRVYSFNDDDNGDDVDDIPTLIDDLSKPTTSVVSKPIPVRKETICKIGEEVNKSDAKAVFTIDGEGFDVILSEDKGKIFWSPMSASGQRHIPFFPSHVYLVKYFIVSSLNLGIVFVMREILTSSIPFFLF